MSQSARPLADTRLSYPSLPVLSRPQRARVVLDFYEGGDHVHEAEVGWAKIEGDWLLWRADIDSDDIVWQMWPSRSVVCIEWLATDA